MHSRFASSRSVSIPSMSGITRSRMMTFGGASVIAVSSCFPLVAELTSYPMDSATSVINLTIVGSSSVIINDAVCIRDAQYIILNVACGLKI